VSDSFDPELDTTLGEEPPIAIGEPFEMAGETLVTVKLAKLDYETDLVVSGFDWQGRPLVRADNGDLVSPRKAAKALKRRLARLPPELTIAQHIEMAAELNALVEQMDELAEELRQYRDGQPLMFAAMDAAESISKLERELADNMCHYLPTETSPYKMAGLPPPAQCRCGRTPDCLPDSHEEYLPETDE
jgi:hypothetical protein